MSDSRRLVYVSGAPGSGKTSLAVPLAAELGYALLAKDRIKETLHDALGAPEPDRAWSRRLGAAAMELLWALAADAPAVVIEANFRPYSQYERAKLSGLAAQPVEVHCACPVELAVKRWYWERHEVTTKIGVEENRGAQDQPAECSPNWGVGGQDVIRHLIYNGVIHVFLTHCRYFVQPLPHRGIT